MTAIREQGKINENTTLIDIGMFGVSGIGAVYLIEAGKKCLIDCGTQNEAPRLIKTLENLEAFPPDYVLITHSHWDHCQGLPMLRERAKKKKKEFEVLASERAIPLLEDQSFNKVFHPKREFENIKNVSPLKEGDKIDLEGLTLEIFNVPGHIKDHITILDQKNKNIFVGDALGDKFTDRLVVPAFMPPFWNKNDFFASIEKVRQLEFDSMCLGHFGCLYGEEAKNFLDEALNTFNQWWRVFEIAEEEDRLDDIDYLKELVMKETTLTQEILDAADFKLQKFMLKVLLGSVNSFRKLLRKKSITPAEILMPEVLGWLTSGYKISKGVK